LIHLNQNRDYEVVDEIDQKRVAPEFYGSINDISEDFTQISNSKKEGLLKK